MSNYRNSLSSIAEQAQATLAETHNAREKALPLTRGVIRLCADSIRATHRKQFDQARELLTQVRSRLDETRTSLAQHQDIYYTGYVSDAQKEFAEASATLAFISGEPLPRPDDLGVEMAPYLNGLAEAASELRRAILDALRRNDIEPCDRWMAAMDEVYGLLVTIDFPDAVTAGLRRTTDQLRGVLERTRGDLTMAVRQHSLEQRLAGYQRHIENP